MFAIVETGNNQYKVSKGDVLEVNRLDLKEGEEARLDKVLFVSDGKDISIGKPYIEGASVICDVLRQTKGKKVISFKYRRRHGSSRRKKGHRQDWTVLKVKEVVGGGIPS